MTRVAVLDDYLRRAAGLADWATLGPDVEVRFFHDPMDEEPLVEALAAFDVLVLMRERTAFPRRVLERLPRLAFVVTTGMVNASVDLEHLAERGIPVSGTGGGGPAGPGVSTTTEVAWALLLAATKRVAIEDRAVRRGVWQQGFPAVLRGATLGLLGLGRLGGEMVGPARAFGMEVLAWSEHLAEERAAGLGVARVDKDELLARSDVVSIHLRLSDRTRGLLGARELGLLRPSAVLVNTSRGPIVDEAALLEALRAGRLAAAGLDVYDDEPLPPDHPLTALDNVVLSPHLGYVSEEGFAQMYAQAIEDVAAFLAGRPIRLLAPEP